ncbi:DUF1553 domain-containing protein [Portibacter lacus]|uniref:Endo-inulinase n=1 Tax=Portibacter lacus TaxID=1099794 RepID=A0AA37SRX3_9BACT|nr:DUF1553 domain-containing protein [Portibacter lacus]GLR18429.1 endo-inulinase [Portibacter lacus]
MENFLRITSLLLITVLLSNCAWTPPDEIASIYEELPEKVDFNFHVKPILSDKCFACHGPDQNKQKAGLRLDIFENATETLTETGNRAIVPGNPDGSELIHRIFTDDSEVMMPPPESNLTLTPIEKAMLAKWISQGAEYKPHWSFIKPEKASIPRIKDEKWASNEIDHFIGAQLERLNIKPSPQASKEILIRRLYFDLTGLPPTLKEMKAFLADESENAYENLVDRLLDSSTYGERMAADWMDVARYSDTDGYLDDKHRDFSAYRDWVIEAFNQNVSYQDFVTLQLAGDLVENPRKETILPTAFNRLHKKNSEAGIVYEEFRLEYVADRNLTLGKAFLGLSVECARCHDHKYDAISQKEYYELSAFFNSTNDIGTPVYGPGQVPGPSLLLTTDEQDEILSYIDKKIDKKTQQLTEIESRYLADKKVRVENTSELTDSLESTINKALIAHYSFDKLEEKNPKQFNAANQKTPSEYASVHEPELRTGAQNQGVFVNEYTRVILPSKQGWFDMTDPFTISIALHPEKNYPDVTIFSHCEDRRLGLKGYSLFLEDNKPKFIIANSWPSNSIQVLASDPLPIGEWTNLTISYDGLGSAEGVQFYINGQVIAVDRQIDNLYKSIEFVPDIHTYGFRGFVLGMRDKLKTFLGGGLDELKIYNRALSPLEVLYADDDAKASNFLKDKQSEVLVASHFAMMDTQYQKVHEDLLALKTERIDLLDTVQEIMVMGDLPEPRPTYILDRGMYNAPTTEVFPNVPSKVLPFDEDLPRNRLGLAKWLFDADHPLTARVFVNRLWQMHFSKGLVPSSDDFGNQGDLPSHPELLDWLAVTFMESGWDIKKMHKLMVMSSTYQQSSKYREELAEIDAENKLLARGPSSRMTAEMVRDNALAISGLLSHKLGGESVYPYQPEGLWNELTNKKWRYKYLQEPGEGLYRRSLYTIWKRTSPPPSMTIFDVAERGVCTVNRRETSTPLQALVLLNDPQYIEASRVLAENLLANYDSVDARLSNAYQLATGRLPNQQEKLVLGQFYSDEVTKFSERIDDAEAFVSIGSSAPTSEQNVAEVAALATVLNGIMNTTDGFTIR